MQSLKKIHAWAQMKVPLSRAIQHYRSSTLSNVVDNDNVAFSLKDVVLLPPLNTLTPYTKRVVFSQTH